MIRGNVNDPVEGEKLCIQKKCMYTFFPKSIIADFKNIKNGYSVLSECQVHVNCQCPVLDLGALTKWLACQASLHSDNSEN
jgi:hypothetical protein